MQKTMQAVIVAFTLILASNVYLFSQDLEKFNGEDGKYGFKNKATGEVVIQPQYDDAGSAFIDGLVWVKSDAKYGYIDATGKVVIPFEYDAAADFSGGVAKVKQGTEEFYINKTGERVNKE